MCGSTSRRFSAKVVLGILRNRGYLGEVSLRRTPSTRRRPHRPRSVRQGANVLAERGESYDRRFTDKHPEYLPAAKATATATTPAGPDSATAQTPATANASAPTSSKQPSSTPTRRVRRPRPHRRPVHLHRPAAHSREHPQDPRLAGPHRQRQDQHHPPGTATPRQPARLPPRRLTARSTHRHHCPPPPSRAAATPQTARTPQPGCR